ncbi:unnamed protein product [Agarophyton chilense]|eukprot:gb/GEZJ01004297.1/.p1 GENE.gb/GEZJ01004297.1/~~gb/GEZJ01004297.1/.p1  ORF type:complete len:916 (+),score=113.13 gb/GEZJ01004297.1/:1924-4671(+)
MGARYDILPSPDADELIDFTCASPWERLALDIELELRSWGLHDGQHSTGRVHGRDVTTATKHISCSTLEPAPTAVSQISFGDRDLVLQLRAWSPTNALDAFPLERLLGVTECVLLTANSPDGIAANDGSDASVLLSAMSVAASACGCPVPMIVPVGRPTSLRFIGRQLFPSHKRFSCDYNHLTPVDFSHLAGLLHLFRNKRSSARRLNPARGSDANICAKFTYDWNDFSFRLTPTPGSFASERRLSAVQAGALNESDPVARIQITAIWDEFPATDLQHTEVLAGMPASTASRLRLYPPKELVKEIASASIPSLRIPMTTPSRSNLRLAQIAANMRENYLPAAPLAVVDVVRIVQSRDEGKPEMPPRRSHLNGEGRSHSPRVARSPAPTALDEYLVQVAEFVAAAAIQDDRIDEEFLTSAVASLFEMDLGRGIMVDVVEALGPNASELTVLERVSRLLAACDTVNAAQKLWNLFLDGIEVHWEQQWIVCGVPFSMEAGPDHNESLVTQKLQMINCCVERRRREAAGLAISVAGLGRDEMGRKKLLEGIELIGAKEHGEQEHASEEDSLVWEPYVQPHLLVTRDMVEEELKRMVRRAESNHHRERNDEGEGRRQSLTLKSDMMAFKAANPGAGMADFVRWFSPADWITDDDCEDANMQTSVGQTKVSNEKSHTAEARKQGSITQEKSTDKREKGRKGRLSTRMSQSGNVWERLWERAESLAASKQEPLFDASAHGSKALADLRAMPMTQVLLHLCVIQAASTTKILYHAFRRPPSLPAVRASIERAKHAIRDVCSGLRLNGTDVAEMGRVAAALDTVAIAEHSALVATSVLTKLPPTDTMGSIVDRVACGEYSEVVDDKEKKLVIRMAGLDDGGWRSVMLPEWREFVIRGDDGDRMYVRLSGEEFRVAFGLALDYSI